MAARSSNVNGGDEFLDRLVNVLEQLENAWLYNPIVYMRTI